MKLRICAVALALLGMISGAVAAGDEDPNHPLWVEIKQALLGPIGDEYFETGLKGSLIPRLSSTLLSCQLNENHKSRLVLAVSDATTPEVTLILQHPERKLKPLQPGTRIQFEGRSEFFSKKPFMLTIQAESGSVWGIEYVPDLQTKP